MDLSNSINRVIVSINSNKSISKSDDKNKWKLTDSIKEKITELAKKDAENNIYMGNVFMNLRKAEVAKVAPNRAALIGKFNQSMSSGNMGDMKEIQEADKRWLCILFGIPYEAEYQGEGTGSAIHIYNKGGEEVLTYTQGVGWHEKETKAETSVHSALKSAYYEAYISLNIYGDTITIEADGSLPSISPFPILFIQILGIASLFCIMFSYKKLMESFKLSRELSLLELEKHSLNQYVEEAKIRYEKTKSFRHDVKNHISIVKELVQNGNIDAALKYMSDMENLTADMSFPVSTNNPVLDILIGNKLGIAKNNQIVVQCSFIASYPCGIADIDFCIIFSNALDNAISACNRMNHDEQKYIHVTGKVQGDFLLIEISNSYSGRGSLRSGTGLANIKAVAEKYHGAMEVRTDGEKFTLSVLLIIPQQSESISQQVC